VYFVTGHGMDISGSPPTAALDPLVAIMQNGPTKGGDQAVVKTMRTFPDLEGLWQAHSYVRNPDLNGDPSYIANLDQQPDKAYPIEMEISPAGQIQVTNGRNQFSKSYTARGVQKHAGK
jgi:competence protein ComEC